MFQKDVIVVRRKKIEAEATRNHILNTAEYCFCENGISNTTLQMIASRAGVTRGAVYWHFMEKEDLLRCVIARTPINFLDDLVEIKENSMRPLYSTGEFLRERLEIVKNNKRLQNVLKIVLLSEEYSDKKIIGIFQNKIESKHIINLLREITIEAKNKEELRDSVNKERLIFLIFTIFSSTLRNILKPSSDNWIISEGISSLKTIISSSLINGDNDENYL